MKKTNTGIETLGMRRCGEEITAIFRVLLLLMSFFQVVRVSMLLSLCMHDCRGSVTSVGSLQLVHYESMLFVRGTVPYRFSWCYKLVYKKDMVAKITDGHEYDNITFNNMNMTFNIFSKKCKNAAIGTLFWLNC